MLKGNQIIETELEEALRNGEFALYLQPKVNMVSSRLYGAEALSRWIHPIDGIRPPDSYIPFFEQSGFILKLDMYMFEAVCRLKASWSGMPYAHIPISVNLSRQHLYNSELPDMLLDTAKKYNIPPEELELEITENVFVEDNSELINMALLLKKRGFLVSVDDFGSGYSALNLLKDLPIDTVKIDKGFLNGSVDNRKGRVVIKSVISMCLDLKLDVVTEGIETEEQINFIKSCGCQIAQGFYYSKPLPVIEFERFAGEHLIHTLNNYTFRLDGSLKSADGSLEAVISGKGLEYRKGIYKNSQSMYFPGGPTEKNTLHIPCSTIVNDSFSVSLWIKPEQLMDWASAIYIKYESGFCSIIPRNHHAHSDFRIRDSKEVNGWYDITGRPLCENIWTHFFITYNAKSEVAMAFIDGELIGRLENVPTNRYVKWIILGGDVFQPSFIGCLCELIIYNEAKNEGFVKNLYRTYVENSDFAGC